MPDPAHIYTHRYQLPNSASIYNNLHLHGNLYKYYPTGTDLVPSFYTDMITLSQTERGIMEFEYQYPGKYLFHAHKVEFSEKGWVGIFLARDNPEKSRETEYDT